ncbi:MAG: TolC family outer membrane protein [Lysobacter sp.]|nr:TolC family outer membrane protein [Lysobacter sp.]MDQ3205618.1 TolC family outer membrane protein [Pseudomonadota bacterium]
MIHRPLVLALALALLPTAAGAADLLQAYELARAGDAQFSAAEATRLAIREGAVQARAAMLPQINGEGTYTRSETDSAGNQVFGSVLFPSNTTQETTTRNFGVNLSQMVFDRARFTQLRSQRALSRASDFQLESAGDNLVTRTSAAYFNVLVQLETLAAAEAAEAALNKQFDYASKRLEVGLAPITDVHEARAQFDTARANTIIARNAVEDAYQALAEITDTQLRNLQGLPADFQPELPASQGVEEWVRIAIENNPALRAQEFQVESVAADVDTARAGHWPTLYLGGNYADRDTDGTSINNLDDTITDFNSQSESRSLALTLNVPIFAGGATQSQVRQALARRDVASAELEQQRRALERNTRNTYQTLVAGISEVEARRLALFSAQSAYDASQVGLEVGTRTVLDVLNNQNNLFTAQRAYALARYNYLQNRLLLEQAAGTLDIDDVQQVNRLLTVSANVPPAVRDTP